MADTQTLVGLIAETSLHAGAGQSLGGIDLPIQREAHTGWPCIYGSAVKGAFRAWAHDIQLEGLDQIFGPDSETTQAASGKQLAHAGALLFSDAKLLLVPVRSLTTHFKWVTSRALLERLQRDAERFGHQDLANIVLPDTWPKRGEALIPTSHSSEEQNLYLEEYRFQCQPTDLNNLCKALAKFTARKHFAAHLERQLVIVDDDDFTYLSRYATPVTPHIRIEYDKKTVQEGALWYEETLPPDSLLYFAIKALKSRKPQQDGKKPDDFLSLDAVTILTRFAEKLKESRANYVQFGSNETVGMGWCQVTLLIEKEDTSSLNEKKDAP